MWDEVSFVSNLNYVMTQKRAACHWRQEVSRSHSNNYECRFNTDSFVNSSRQMSRL